MHVVHVLIDFTLIIMFLSKPFTTTIVSALPQLRMRLTTSPSKVARKLMRLSPNLTGFQSGLRLPPIGLRSFHEFHRLLHCHGEPDHNCWDRLALTKQACVNVSRRMTIGKVPMADGTPSKNTDICCHLIRCLRSSRWDVISEFLNWYSWLAIHIKKHEWHVCGQGLARLL